jgi:vacuolar-type H+-ATPase subunit F/Vma7
MPEESAIDNAIAIVGDEDIVIGFKAMGFKVYPVRVPQDALGALEEVVGSKNAVCLVQDDIYQSTVEQINLYKTLPLPVFIPFSRKAQENLLQDMVREIKLRASGTV